MARLKDVTAAAQELSKGLRRARDRGWPVRSDRVAATLEPPASLGRNGRAHDAISLCDQKTYDCEANSAGLLANLARRLARPKT